MPPRKRAPAKKSTALVKRPPAKKAPAKQAAPPPPPPVALVQRRIGQRNYAVAMDMRCPVCVHPLRPEIEERILLGDHYADIARWLSGKQYERIDGTDVLLPELTAPQITAHYRNGHSALDAQVVHDIHEQVAGEQDYEAAGARLTDGLALAKRIIGRVEERVVRGELEPTVKDGIAASRLDVAAKIAAAQVAESSQAADQSWFYEQSFDIYLAKAREIMNPEQWEQFMEALYQDQTLQSLIERRNGAVDAVLVEEKSA